MIVCAIDAAGYLVSMFDATPAQLIGRKDIVTAVLPAPPVGTRPRWDGASWRFEGRDGDDLDLTRTAMWKVAKAKRTQREYGGFTWNGFRLQSDAESQRRILVAVQMATSDPDYTVDWTMADNTVARLSASDMVTIGEALAAHVRAAHEWSQQMREQITTATRAKLNRIQL